MNRKPNFFREKLDAFFCSVFSDVFVRPDEFRLNMEEVEGDIFRDNFFSSGAGSKGGGVETLCL